MKNSISTVDQKPDDLGPQWVKRIPVAKWGWNSPDRNSPDIVGIPRTSFCLLKKLEFPGQVLFGEKSL